jgi:hypothetical protein
MVYSPQNRIHCADGALDNHHNHINQPRFLMSRSGKAIVIITLFLAFLVLLFMTLSARAMSQTTVAQDAACTKSDELRIKIANNPDFHYIRSLTKPELMLLQGRYLSDGHDYTFSAIDLYKYTGTDKVPYTGKTLFMTFNAEGCYSYTFYPDAKYSEGIISSE